MKILEVKTLAIPEIKIIKFARFTDQRGYFTETFRKSIILNQPELKSILKNREILQCNESLSKKNVIRGMHFQWNPYMGKFIRTISGKMIDLVLDIRKGSPSFGKMIAYEMPNSFENDFDEWIWIPPGFAHGNCFLADTVIEYLCTGEYNQDCEISISPFAKDIDWSLCEKKLKSTFDKIASTSKLITDKDRNGLSMNDWEKSQNSEKFIYGKL